MGHSEMLLAVAGLNGEEIKDRTTKLAQGNWDIFSVAEQTAYQFAYHLTKKPANVTGKRVADLVSAYGRARAFDVIWWGGWGNYMTRVADAFQLPLETENVFALMKRK